MTLFISFIDIYVVVIVNGLWFVISILLLQAWFLFDIALKLPVYLRKFVSIWWNLMVYFRMDCPVESWYDRIVIKQVLHNTAANITLFICWQKVV